MDKIKILRRTMLITFLVVGLVIILFRNYLYEGERKHRRNWFCI